MKGSVILSVVCLVVFGYGGEGHAQTLPTSDQLSGIGARSIGPGGMSGRVSDVDVVLSDPNRIFVGSATGGVWRSEDGGLAWVPIFDDQPVLGIGAVSVFQPDPNIVWVGTGEGNPRNSAGVGAGVFVSRDGGDSWLNVGLEKSERIHRIVLHPSDPDIAWVAALGPAWSDGEERGVFRTDDGGESWERVLFTNARSGAAELVIDPTDPDRLVAAMWEYRREPWFFESGGPGSGLFVSEDGGRTWLQRTSDNGLPEGDLGRMGLAFAPSEPGVLYALVEAERSVLLRSEDSGKTFEVVSDREGVAPRPFYYADLRVDPQNADRLYSLHSQLQVSQNGGEAFRTVVSSSIIHGDVHELWIHPTDPRFMIMGNDGGIAFTKNRGETWRFVENLVLAQFYHIALDNAVPFNVYGGLQDNGSWFGPSTVWENRGIMNAHWTRVGGGDGFSVLPDFADESYGYAMSQGGNLTRFDRRTGARKSIRPTHDGETALRFNWNAALATDPIDSTTLYLGSQFVHRTTDQGATWTTISPDLTSNNPAKQRQSLSGGLSLDATGAENHTTIISIAPSPIEAGLIWVGTDDGRVQVTRNGGADWNEVGRALPDVAPDSWVAHVEASKHTPGRAYVVVDEHRRGDWETYLFVTHNYGGDWLRLPTDEVTGFAHVVEEDPSSPSLLYLGTEFGLYVSLDGGQSWLPWRDGVPAVPIRDMQVHTRDHDLVLGTHGRGILIVDDVRPLQALANEGVPGVLTFFGPPPAIAAGTHEAPGYRSTGHAMQFGSMRPYGALLTFWYGQASEPYQVEVEDPSGARVAHLEGQTKSGLNRVHWNLRMELEGVLGARPTALPGDYTVRVSVGAERAEVTLQVVPDPRRPHDGAARVAKLEAIKEAGGRVAAVTEARNVVRQSMRTLEGLLEGQASLPRPLRERAEDVLGMLQGLNREAFAGPECQGICGGTVLLSDVTRPLRTLGSSWDAPTNLERTQMERGRVTAVQIVERVNALVRGPMTRLRADLEAVGIEDFDVADLLTVPG